MLGSNTVAYNNRVLKQMFSSIIFKVIKSIYAIEYVKLEEKYDEYYKKLKNLSYDLL